MTANLEMSAYSVVEGMLQLSVCANLSEAIERDVAVGISTSSGSASGVLMTVFLQVSLIDICIQISLYDV